MESTILNYFLAINLILMLSFFFFKSARRMIEKSGMAISFLSLNRIAQLLFVTAILTPLSFSLVPNHSFPKIRIDVRAPLADALASKNIKPTALEKGTELTKNNSHTAKTPLLPNLSLMEIFGVFALSISVCILLRMLLQMNQLRRLIQNSIVIRQVGKVRILVSEGITIPFSTLIGGINIVVPANSILDVPNLKIIIRHELHHHRNGDTLWILVMEALSCVFFLNPFFHLWKKEFNEIQEFACDEMLISQMRVSAYEYGQCLIKVAEATQKSSFMQVGTTCMGGALREPQQIKSFLRRRIEVFKDHQKAPRRSFGAVIIGTVGVFMTASLAYAAQQSLRAEELQTPNKGTAAYDAEIQKISEDILRKNVAKFGAKGGFVLVADPKTGKILAVANQLKTKRPLPRSWSLSYEIEPASAMKSLIIARALDLNLLQSDEKMDCENGRYRYGDRTYRDWKPMGILTAAEAIYHSSNICGIKMGERLGAARLEANLKDFGFGPGGSAKDFPGAMPGHYPKASQMPETDYIPLLATGYTSSPGFHATSLEILQAYAAIANEGKLMKPLQVTSSSEGQVIKQVMSAATAQKMKSILVGVVKKGTGQNARSHLYTTAGKTSTAYRPGVPEHRTLGGERSMAGFVGFAPVENPRLVVYVGIIDPTNSEDGNAHGNEHAAPVFREVIDTVLSGMNVSSDIK